ncbi:MAG TPA: hypothetical protein VGM42_18650, partial [Rhodopila sp.]
MSDPSSSRRNRFVPFGLLALGLVVAVFAVLHAIPPSSITIETGPIGGSYYDIALAYRQALREHGIDAILKPNPDSL